MIWKTVKLGDVCDFVRGPFGGSLKKNMFSTTGYAVYEQQHAINNQCKDFRYYISEQKFDEMKRFEVKSGDVLMSCSGTIGKTTIVPMDAPVGIINQALLKITPHKTIDVNYLKYFMNSKLFSNQLMSTVDGAAIQNVASVKILKEISIFLPPLAEQQRILAKLDAAFAQIDMVLAHSISQRKNIQQLHAVFLSSVLNEDNGKWKTVLLGDVAKAVGGNGFPKKYQSNKDKPIPFYKVGDMNSAGNEKEMNVANNYVDETDLKEMRAKWHPAGTIIFPKIGGAISTNKKRILKSHAAFDNNVMGVIPNTSLILPEYLYKVFLSLDLYELSNKAALPSITNGAVEEIDICLPSLSEQERIIIKLDNAFAQIKTAGIAAKKKQANYEALKSAILAQELQSEAA